MITKYESIIVKTLGRLLAPFIQLFALYVIAHGHESPGGGFQGGVILGASFILLAVVYGLDEARKRMPDKLMIALVAIGVFIYAGTGALCLLYGGNFLDYSKLPFPVGPAEARALGILSVEIGVGITVMAVMLSIFLALASHYKKLKTGRGEIQC
ncbi:MAG: Na(+)/H(+) antiporter subunit B [Candidatus Desulfofervidaceae bacterium]|nr:Na(+)/H(+) antiporter subunit B [Candidatus Desulfofervidaceae bacterium]